MDRRQASDDLWQQNAALDRKIADLKAVSWFLYPNNVVSKINNNDKGLGSVYKEYANCAFSLEDYKFAFELIKKNDQNHEQTLATLSRKLRSAVEALKKQLKETNNINGLINIFATLSNFEIAQGLYANAPLSIIEGRRLMNYSTQVNDNSVQYSHHDAFKATQTTEDWQMNCILKILGQIISLLLMRSYFGDYRGQTFYTGDMSFGWVDMIISTFIAIWALLLFNVFGWGFFGYGRETSSSNTGQKIILYYFPPEPEGAADNNNPIIKEMYKVLYLTFFLTGKMQKGQSLLNMSEFGIDRCLRVLSKVDFNNNISELIKKYISLLQKAQTQLQEASWGVGFRSRTPSI